MTTASHTGGTVLNGYELLEVLGQGGMGTTWRARRSGGTEEYALKLLNVERVDDWKSVELFEREVAALKSIQHPLVPAYIDAFVAEEGRAMALVQTLAPGETLKARVERGRVFNLDEFTSVADQLLSVLEHLQTLEPPLIHRDIKPQNVLIDDAGVARLVDFGAVRLADHDPRASNSTVVGTFGYMPPEQFSGSSSLATDLYGLGATLLFTATGQHPEAFEHVRMEIQFADAVSLPARLVAWLQTMLAPMPEDRFPDAASARKALRAPPAPPRIGPLVVAHADGALTVREPRPVLWRTLLLAVITLPITLPVAGCLAGFPLAVVWNAIAPQPEPDPNVWALRIGAAAMIGLPMLYFLTRHQTLGVMDGELVLRVTSGFGSKKKAWPLAWSEPEMLCAEESELPFYGPFFRFRSWVGSAQGSLKAFFGLGRGVRVKVPGRTLVLGRQLTKPQRHELRALLWAEHARRLGRGERPAAAPESEEV